MDAVKALRSSPDKVSITVCDGYDLKDVMRRKSEAEAMASSRAEKSKRGGWSKGNEVRLLLCGDGSTKDGMGYSVASSLRQPACMAITSTTLILVSCLHGSKLLKEG